MKSISDLRIGIVIIGVSLLSLLYPLMYSYLANLMQQLFDLQKRAKDNKAWETLCEDTKRKINDTIKKVKDYYLISSFILNIFFPTGLGFIFSSILLQFYNEEHLCDLCIKFSLRCIPILLFLWVFLLWRLDIKPHQEEWSGSKIANKYPLLPGLFLFLYCAYLIFFYIIVLSTPKIQYYCLLLHYGLILSGIVLFWFFVGIIYKTIRNLEKLREILL